MSWDEGIGAMIALMNFDTHRSLVTHTPSIEMNTNTSRSLSDIYRNWQSEDRQLGICIDEVRKWMQEVSQLGVPHFGETATRLGPLRRRLVQHFEREDEMIAEIVKSHLTSTRKVKAMGKQSSRDRNRLFSQLDDLISRLNQLDPPFASWERAIEEVELFVDKLEQHENREAKSIHALIPDQQPSD
jgi:hypothetical protein